VNNLHHGGRGGHRGIIATETRYAESRDAREGTSAAEPRRASQRDARDRNRIDEIGYLTYDARAADLLLQIVSRRDEQKSLLVTTNLPFKPWDTIFRL
jgi:hypothetical protein